MKRGGGNSNGGDGNARPRTHRSSTGESYDETGRSTSNQVGIPFRDADPTTSEIPLDEIDTFVHAARDDKGVSIRISFNVPPYMERMIQIIIKSNRFPYLRDADFWRHAAYRHVHFCVGLRQSIPKHILPIIDAIGEICRDEEIRHRMQECFEQVERRVRYLQGRGEKSEMIRLINLVNARVSELPPSHWQRKFQTEFSEKYNRHLTAGPVGEAGHGQRKITGELGGVDGGDGGGGGTRQ